MWESNQPLNLWSKSDALLTKLSRANIWTGLNGTPPTTTTMNNLCSLRSPSQALSPGRRYALNSRGWSWHQMWWAGRNDEGKDWDLNLGPLSFLSGAQLTELSGSQFIIYFLWIITGKKQSPIFYFNVFDEFLIKLIQCFNEYILAVTFWMGYSSWGGWGLKKCRGGTDLYK